MNRPRKRGRASKAKAADKPSGAADKRPGAAAGQPGTEAKQRTPSTDAPPGALPRALPWLIAVAIAATFARAVPYGLQHTWDDDRFITDNPLVQQVSLDNLVAIFAAPHFEAYHPLHLLSYWLDVPASGGSATALHVTSLALWGAAGVLALRAMRALGLSPAAATIATLLCVLHPVQVEVVSWASGRKDALAMLAACGALLLHLRAKDAWDRFAWAARAVYALGLLSKTTIVPLPAVLLLWDVCSGRRRLGQALVMQLPALAVAGAAAPAVLQIWQDNEMVRATVGGPQLAPLRFANTLAHSLTTACWPAEVAPMYASTALSELTAATFVAPAALVIAALACLRAGRRELLFALGAFVLLLLPVANLVPMYFPFQDRYLSLPLLALGYGAGATLDAAAARPPLRHVHVLGLLAVALLAGRTLQYQGQWASETRLWGHAASTQPRAYYAWMKLGETRRKAGQHDGAIAAYRQLLVIDPARKLGHAALLQAVAQRDEAIWGIEPSRAQAYAARYYTQMTSPDALLTLSGQMLRTGHLRSIEIVTGRALALQQFPDDALRKAAIAHFEAGRASLGLFYLRHLRAEVSDPRLLHYRQRALGRVHDLRLPYARAAPVP